MLNNCVRYFMRTLLLSIPLLAFSMNEGKAASVALAPISYGGSAYDLAEGFANGIGSTYSLYNPNFTGPGTYAANLSQSYNGIRGAATINASTIISTASAPNISVTGNLSTIGGPNLGVSAGMTSNSLLSYQFQIAGPSGSVPVLIQAAGGVSISGEAPGALSDQSANVSFMVQNTAFSIVQDSASLDAYNGLTVYTGPTSQSFTENGTYSLQTGVIYTVTMDAEINGGIDGERGGGEESLTAYLDPLFTIAAADPDDYSLVFSDGINNVADTPLPSSSALMLAGFAVLGWVGYRGSCKRSLIMA